MPAATDGPLDGQALLDAVTHEMIALHKHYYGRAPGHTHTRLMDHDLLAVLMGEVYTEVEKTMIELQRQATVKETRSAFQQATQQRFIAAVERLSGRRVQHFISTHHVGPDLELELFFLEPAAS